jgi:hypothetical protein
MIAIILSAIIAAFIFGMYNTPDINPNIGLKVIHERNNITIKSISGYPSNHEGDLFFVTINGIRQADFRVLKIGDEKVYSGYSYRNNTVIISTKNAVYYNTVI